MRNGEQLLLTLIIPVLLLIAFSLDAPGQGGLRPAGAGRLPGAGHDRARGAVHRVHQPGHRHRVRAPVRRAQAARLHPAVPRRADRGEDRHGDRASRLAQAVILLGVGLALGWQPNAGPAAAIWVVLLVLAGTAAFSGLALLLAGTLRAEATLALANLVYLVLLGIGGIIFPLTKFPAAARPVLTLLPSGALSDGLHTVLQHGAGLPAARPGGAGRLGGRSPSRWPRGCSAGSEVPGSREPRAAGQPWLPLARRAALGAGRHRHLLGPVRRRARGQAVRPDRARSRHRRCGCGRPRP